MRCVKGWRLSLVPDAHHSTDVQCEGVCGLEVRCWQCDQLTFYWRVVGQGPPAVQCLKNALHYGPDNMRVCGCGHPWKLL